MVFTKIYQGIFIVMLTGLCWSQAWAADELTWQECLREAAQNHPDLIAAHEDIVQSQAIKKITAAGVLPDLVAELNAATSKSSQTGSQNNFSYGLAAQQLLFDGGKTLGSIRGATENIKVATFGYQFASSDVRLRLRQAFVNMLKAQELIKLTQEIYAIRKSNLELMTLRYESGTEHRGALLTAKANISQATYEIHSAQRFLTEAQRELVKELGRKDFAAVQVRADFDAGPLEDTAPVFETIADKTPAVLKVIAQKNAAAFDIQSRRGEFWPSVVLSGGASKADQRWSPDENETTAGVGVTLPLFAGGTNVARLAQSRSLYRQLEEKERSIRDEITLGLQKAWNQLVDAAERVRVQQDFLNATEERAKIAQAQYEVGLMSFDNWTIIEDALVGGRKTFLDVQIAALVAQANWIYAQGKTVEYEK